MPSCLTSSTYFKRPRLECPISHSDESDLGTVPQSEEDQGIVSPQLSDPEVEISDSEECVLKEPQYNFEITDQDIGVEISDQDISVEISDQDISDQCSDIQMLDEEEPMEIVEQLLEDQQFLEEQDAEMVDHDNNETSDNDDDSGEDQVNSIILISMTLYALLSKILVLLFFCFFPSFQLQFDAISVQLQFNAISVQLQFDSISVQLQFDAISVPILCNFSFVFFCRSCTNF